jgi:hypothetical protein
MDNEWRLIRSAPTNGASLLLWQPTNHGGYWVVGSYDVKVRQWVEDMEGLSLAPTHWRPLPEPPQQEMDRSNSRA